MIVRILSAGKSFSGLSAYLTHDPKAETAERIGWTHTLNLANDHVPSAVDEMLWTSRHAELLKQEAGIRAGGRATENAVKHLSLNWSPEDQPTREHMIETTEGFLRHMGWQDHQAVLVSHTDKPYAHVHVMLNIVNPDNGLRLDDGFERRRAQTWAFDYEREQGRIYCEQRLEDIGAREEGPTRPAWMAFQEKEKEYQREEKSRRDREPILVGEPENPKDIQAGEWKILKDLQRQERLEFFSDGKAAFSELRLSVYREVREEFRERWSDFYAAARDGGDATALAEIKAELVAEQKAALETRRDEACGELRASRDGLYRELLDDQKEGRAGLRWRQEAGLDNTLFLETAKERNVSTDVTAGFRDAADATTRRQVGDEWTVPATGFSAEARPEKSGMRSGPDVAVTLGFGLLSIFDSLADGLVPSNPAPRSQQPDPSGPSPFHLAAEEVRTLQQHEREGADDDWYRKQRSLYGD